METERKGGTTFKGSPLTLIGAKLEAGQTAPEFKALAGDLSEVSLSSAQGKTRFIIAVPSLDTPVCDQETRRFNQEAANMPGVVTWVISMDLPFAQGRFCQTAGIKNLKTLSDHRDGSFGKAFGVLIKELRLLSRAVFVVDAQGIVRYVEYVPEMTNHPNYEAALNALKAGAAA
jgi:thiol peroxidase